MRTKLILALVTISLIIGSFAAFAQIVPDKTKEALISASASQRMKVHEALLKNYPNLPDDTFLFLEENYPHFTTRFLRSKLSELQSMDSRTLADLYRKVSKEIDDKYGVARSTFRKESFSLLSEKYPDMQKEMKGWRDKNGLRVNIAEHIQGKYPGFRADCMQVIKEKHPAIFMTIVRDAMSTIIEKDPKLPIEIKMEISSTVQEQSPEIFAQIASNPRAMNPMKFREMVRDNPKLAAALIDKMESRFGSRIRELKRSVISHLIEKDSKELFSLCNDLLSMIETKYPDLPKELVTKALESRKEFGKEMRDSHKEFFRDLAEQRNKSFPYLLKDVTASVDKFNPEFRSKMKSAMEREFPGIEKKTKDFIDRKYPELNSTIVQLLK
ncbi:MAG: hypothetical protein AB2L14_14870 [Candidatus Xenobiia bacterium LiM19]